jgi:uncharacterized protein YndB with AHSA1/START domain
MTEPFRTSIHIEAAPDRVFDYLVKPELLVRWMGDFAQLEAKDGGVFAVDIYGVLIRGSYVVVDRPNRVVIAWGELGNARMPPGSTQVEIRLVPTSSGTRVELEHTGLAGLEAEKHAIGWPHFVARLGLAAGGTDPGVDPWRKAAPPQ